jgi:hypothetical protein
LLEQWNVAVSAENMDEAYIDRESMKFHVHLHFTHVHLVFQFLPDPPGLEEEIMNPDYLNLVVLLHKMFTSGIFLNVLC